jgi:hypothetical protein
MSTGRGMAQKSLDLIEHSRRILAGIHPTSSRGVAYQLFTRGLIENMGGPCVAKVAHLLVLAREKGFIPWEWIVDDTRQEEGVSTWKGLGEFSEQCARQYRDDFWKQQDSWLKVVTEKSTIIGAVAPILNEFAVRWKVMHGYGSATALHDIAETSLNDDERSLEILYIGDFDPFGMHMSEVDLPGRIEKYDGVVTITRIALTCDDVEAGGLPSFDIETKSKDPRFRWFRENYGERCWELDAMNPNDLRRRLREEIWSRIDHEAWDHCKVVEAAEKESYGRYIKAWPGIPNQDQKNPAPRDREAAP